MTGMEPEKEKNLPENGIIKQSWIDTGKKGIYWMR